MKNFKNIIGKFWFAGMVVLLTISCDLAFQEEWEYVREPLGNIPTGLTAYEWIQSINQDTTFNDNNDLPEFSFLLEAIERTGMQEDFDGDTLQRTYFLLRNSAWNGNNQLIQNIAGNAEYPLDSIEDTERLASVLRYHILNDVVDQGRGVPKSDAHFYYQTLIPGDTGIMEINRRLWNASLRINQSVARIGSSDIPSAMPTSARGAQVELHNYQFTNGVGHQLTSHVRYQPY